MQPKHNKDLVPFAKDLRKNMTKDERHLWYDFLKKHKYRFSRQKVLGRYIADFYSAELNLVIELDGSEHYTPEARAYDEERSAFLRGYGINVLRINNMEINRNFCGACAYIDKTIETLLKEE